MEEKYRREEKVEEKRNNGENRKDDVEQGRERWEGEVNGKEVQI